MDLRCFVYTDIPNNTGNVFLNGAPFGTPWKITFNLMCVIWRFPGNELSNTSLFEDQPGLVSPSVTVHNQVTGRYSLPIVNNTGITFNVKNKTMIYFIEQLFI